MCVAFGYLTKPSVSIQMLIIAIWLLFVWIGERRSRREAFLCVIASFISIIILIFPNLIRNFITFESYSNPIAGKEQLIGTLEPRYVLVNFLKNFCYNLPNKYDLFSIKRIQDFAVKVANMLNVEIDKPSISEDGVSYYVRFSYIFDNATNFIIIILLLASVVFLGLNWKKLEKTYKDFSIITIVCIVAFLQYSGGKDTLVDI